MTNPDVMPSLHEYGQGVIGTSNAGGRDISSCWYACEYPERPTDPFVLWHCQHCCRGCRIAAEALLNRAFARWNRVLVRRYRPDPPPKVF